MSQQSDLPAETPPPVPPVKNEKGEIVVSGAETYLPESAIVHPGDREFEDIVRGVLPEYAPSLSEEALRRPRGYPVWAILLILLFLGSLLASIYFLRRQMPIVTTTLDVPPPEITKYKGKFFSEYRKAGDYVDSGKYEDARKCLDPVIDGLLKKEEIKPEDDLIFYTYFGLFDKLPWDNDAGEHAKTQLDRLIEQDSNYRWKLFEIKYQLNRMGGEELGRVSRYATAASLNKIIVKIDDLYRLLKGDKKLIRQLDFYKCQFGLKAWRLKNGNKPNDNLGVGDREMVWKIASKEEYKYDETFVSVLEYLVRKLMKETNFRYTFDGEVYLTNERLKFELEEINRVKAKLKEKKK